MTQNLDTNMRNGREELSDAVARGELSLEANWPRVFTPKKSSTSNGRIKFSKKHFRKIPLDAEGLKKYFEEVEDVVSVEGVFPHLREDGTLNYRGADIYYKTEEHVNSNNRNGRRDFYRIH